MQIFNDNKCVPYLGKMFTLCGENVQTFIAIVCKMALRIFLHLRNRKPCTFQKSFLPLNFFLHCFSRICILWLWHYVLPKQHIYFNWKLISHYKISAFFFMKYSGTVYQFFQALNYIKNSDKYNTHLKI